MASSVRHLVAKAEEGAGRLSREELATLLAAEGEDAEILFKAARVLKLKVIGQGISLRALVEMDNHCAKNCYYCGIRRGNRKVKRYRIPVDEVVATALAACRQGFGSVVLQGGEIESEANTRRVEAILRGIRKACGDGFGITLSLGEQTEEVYRRWRGAGAHRYLLRIETSNSALYATLHPAGHSWERRADCLRVLRELGYQTGTGVMWGLPGQTLDDLAADIEFFREMDIDMIGMGPFIPHPDTPLGRGLVVTPEFAAGQIALGLRMVAATRLQLHDVNIAATTALQALDETGREKAIAAGANVLMPNATDTARRKDYQLYPGKPCLEEASDACSACLDLRVRSLGETLLRNVRGDAPHALRAGRGGKVQFEDDSPSGGSGGDTLSTM